MKPRDTEIALMLRIGRQMLEGLDTGKVKPAAAKPMFEAIRVQNTTLRTEIALERLYMTQKPRARR